MRQCTSPVLPPPFLFFLFRPPYFANLTSPCGQPVQAEEVLGAQGGAAHHFPHRLEERRRPKWLHVGIYHLPNSLYVFGIHGPPCAEGLELRDQVDHLVLEGRSGATEGQREGVMGEDTALLDACPFNQSSSPPFSSLFYYLLIEILQLPSVQPRSRLVNLTLEILT